MFRASEDGKATSTKPRRQVAVVSVGDGGAGKAIRCILLFLAPEQELLLFLHL